jgi:TonB family protein
MSMLLRPMILAAATLSAAGAAAEPRAPTGKWNVDFADAQCVADRDYGTPANPLRLLLKAPPVGGVMQVAVLRGADASPPRQVDSVVTVEGRPPIKVNLLMFTPKGARERIYLLNMPSADFAPAWQAKSLSVRSEGLSVTFALSEMEPLRKIVDECVADLRRVFNVGDIGPDPLRFKRRASANIASVFSSDDYPAVAVMKGQGGKVRFALLIREDGRVADCTVIETSGVASLDTQACAMLKRRAKFQPAIGIDGKPAKDSVVGAITWRP